jgi:cytoskeletal protein CcmA (bactofilin family)
MSVKKVLRLLHRERKTVVERPAPAARHIGVLGLDTRVLGNVKFQGSLTVDGTITGYVQAPEGTGAMLVVGQNASVTGNIVADSVLVSGHIAGDVKACERLEIFETGVLHGNVETRDIMIQGGAEFRGHCQMQKQQPALREVENVETPVDDSFRGQGAQTDNSRKNRKTKGKQDRSDANGHGVGVAVGTTATDSVAGQQDSRMERGSSSEGTSA